MALLPPTEKQEEAIKQLYYYKDPDTLEEDIDALIEWLSKQPHLPSIEGSWIFLYFLYSKHNICNIRNTFLHTKID